MHEIAHALIRDDRVDGDPELTYAEEELVVEMVAYSVCGGLGLDVAGYSVGYLTSWSQDTPIETIDRTAALIDGLANRIETALGEAPDD